MAGELMDCHPVSTFVEKESRRPASSPTIRTWGDQWPGILVGASCQLFASRLDWLDLKRRGTGRVDLPFTDQHAL